MINGISTASFFTKLFTEETFKYLKEYRAECAEVFFGCTSEYNGKYTADIVKEAKASGVRIHSVHGLTNQYEPELFSLNARAAEDAEKIFFGLLATAKELGAKNYTLHGPSKLKNKPYHHDYKRLGRVMNSLIDRASEYGISINYENVHWAFFSNPNYFVKLQRECPRMGATLDIKQAIQSGYSYTEYFDVVKDSLKTVHVCDVDSNGQMLLPGRGKFDYIELYKRLEDIGFKGAVIMEVYPESYRDFSEIKSAYEFLLEAANKAGVNREYQP